MSSPKQYKYLDRERIQAEARPGESWEEAAARLARASTNKPSLDNGELVDCFVLTDGLPLKDVRDYMDVALFRMSKRERR